MYEFSTLSSFGYPYKAPSSEFSDKRREFGAFVEEFREDLVRKLSLSMNDEGIFAFVVP